jgi:hypothetical protein
VRGEEDEAQLNKAMELEAGCAVWMCLISTRLLATGATLDGQVDRAVRDPPAVAMDGTVSRGMCGNLSFLEGGLWSPVVGGASCC